MSQILASTNNNLPQNNLDSKEPRGDAEITLLAYKICEEEDTTRCSQRGSNGVQLLLVIEVERTCKSKDHLLEWILYSPYEVANQSIYNSRLIP
jgi:hypothetical protein